MQFQLYKQVFGQEILYYHININYLPSNNEILASLAEVGKNLML